MCLVEQEEMRAHASVAFIDFARGDKQVSI